MALVYQVIPAPLSVQVHLSPSMHPPTLLDSHHALQCGGQVLGFWMWWLFIVPSLRARKPQAQEKEALNWAFLATPLVSILMPFATKVSLQTRHFRWSMVGT